MSRLLTPILLLLPVVPLAEIVSDHALLKAVAVGKQLEISVNTDLPDTAEIIVTVSRSYWEKGSAVEYSREYFSEKSRVAEWRSPRTVDVDEMKWKADLRAHQTNMAKLGSDMAFEVGSVSDYINARAVLHINQADPRFGGNRNPSLSGKAVTRKAYGNIIEMEAAILIPLSSAPPATSTPLVGWNGLEEGEVYRVLKQVPIMPLPPREIGGLDDSEIFGAMGEMFYIPVGRTFRVIGVAGSRAGNAESLWYEIEVIGNESAGGWLNSIALLPDGAERVSIEE